MARSTGNGASLFPSGVTSIEEVPVDLLRAISHADKILDWHENLMEKDIPPEYMWPFDDALTEWFEDIKAAHESGGDQPDDRTVVPLVSNELAEGRR